LQSQWNKISSLFASIFSRGNGRAVARLLPIFFMDGVYKQAARRRKHSMKRPLKITFRNMPPSKAIEDNIREKAAKLDSFHDEIMSCRVTVEAPHRHHHKGKAYVVRIDMTVPGGELVINREPKRLVAARAGHGEELEKKLAENHEPTTHAAHEDVYVAIRDAFNAAARKLQDHARRRRGEIRPTNPSQRARCENFSPLRNPQIAKKK
jgi:ribosome-associated translation inhibitor RaiA